MKDRSRYRNCYLFSLALMSVVLALIGIGGRYGIRILVLFTNIVLAGVMIAPFFLIHNGIVMIKKEGARLSHMLSLGSGVLILAGEITGVAVLIMGFFTNSREENTAICRTPLFITGTLFTVTIAYASISFLMYMSYILILQIVPWKKDFDYVIIHGSGLINGDKVSKLLKDRLDKAVEVYHRGTGTPKLIPSGGKGSDESISEAEAMKRYLMEKGIPETDIIEEDKSTTTFENLMFSRKIIDSAGGSKKTALVTSNYHVYRALRYCRRMDFKCTGIGSHVAFYYWPSALIREYIAVHAEKKHAVIFILGWILCMVLVIYAFTV